MFVGDSIRLKEELASMQKMSAQLEETHCCQISEALEDLQALSSKHKEELSAVQQQAKHTCTIYNYTSPPLHLHLACIPL